jgi:ribonuclease Z
VRTGALLMAQHIVKEHGPTQLHLPANGGTTTTTTTHLSPLMHCGELIFTGTASAVPCKHRNVTGMMLKQSDGRSIVLDIGEGTIGQLLRMKWNESISTDQLGDDSAFNVNALYDKIKAVWISHPHADHHLGLMRLLKDRQCTEKLLIIAPTPLFRFLDEISVIDPDIHGTYISIDCKDLVGETPQSAIHQRTIESILGMTNCRAVPVAHCAHAYAVILDGTSFGTVVYSGDCRPSTQLAKIAKGADLLIHEATFENGMEADAVLKKHSTIDEALNVGCQMECKCIVLTHFSQRYSKIPPNPSKPDDMYPFPIVFAYDCMKLKPHTLFTASKLTPALRLLFADDTDSNSGTGQDPVKSNGAEILSIPGVFANQMLL